jgi:hypothetical protein
MPEPFLLERLKQRKIIQWALAYLAGAWVVVQLLDAVKDPVGLSEWARAPADRTPPHHRRRRPLHSSGPGSGWRGGKRDPLSWNAND